MLHRYMCIYLFEKCHGSFRGSTIFDKKKICFVLMGKKGRKKERTKDLQFLNFVDFGKFFYVEC